MTYAIIGRFILGGQGGGGRSCPPAHSCAILKYALKVSKNR